MKPGYGRSLCLLPTLLALVVLAGCQAVGARAAQDRMMEPAPAAPAPETTPAPPPPPVAVVEPPPSPAPAPMPVPPAPRVEENTATLYGVWYATNRPAVMSMGNFSGYKDGRDGHNVHYGKIFVEIPKDFLEKQNRATWLSSLLRSAETTLKVQAPIPLSAAGFIETMADQFRQAAPDEKVALIYLHGFRTSFTEAAQRAASIGYQLKIPVTAFFSWPSRGTVAGYVYDRDAVDNSADEIAKFIIKVQKESGAAHVHIIAHSMGNRGLLAAMYRPVMQEAIRHGLRFGQIVLAAPDVDTEYFVDNAGELARIADRVTLYASAGDEALSLSKKLAAHDRAGLTPPVTVVSGIDTVDVSLVNLTLLGHSYVAAEIAVLEDMAKLLMFNTPPAKRTRIWKKSNYWELK